MNKTYEKWTATDIRKYWVKKYQAMTKKPYFTPTYTGLEIKTLKGLLEDNGIWSVLDSIAAYIRRGNVGTISQFAYMFDELVKNQSENPKLEFLVHEHGGDKQKRLWTEYIACESRKSVGLADDMDLMKRIEENLNTWSEVYL